MLRAVLHTVRVRQHLPGTVVFLTSVPIHCPALTMPWRQERAVAPGVPDAAVPLRRRLKRYSGMFASLYSLSVVDLLSSRMVP